MYDNIHIITICCGQRTSSGLYFDNAPSLLNSSKTSLTFFEESAKENQKKPDKRIYMTVNVNDNMSARSVTIWQSCFTHAKTAYSKIHTFHVHMLH